MTIVTGFIQFYVSRVRRSYNGGMKSAVIVFMLIVISASATVVFAEDAPDEPASAAAHEEPAVSASVYEQKIRQMESEHGVYDAELSETLLSLGLVYRAQNKYRQAIETFERSLHIQRVNAGLYNIDQIRLVELIIESASASRDWNQLGDSLFYLLWIYRRNYNDDKGKLLQELKKAGGLILDAYQSGVNDISLIHLVEADDIYDEAAGILKGQNKNKEELAVVLYRTALINYHIAQTVNGSKVSHKEIREAMLESGRAIPDIAEREVRDHFYKQAFFKGKSAISRIIDIYETELPGSLMNYAEALIFMGDWHLAFRQKRNAMPWYGKAYAVLTGNNISEEDINSLLGTPKPLKILVLPGEDVKAANTDSLYVDAILDVSSDGWPANIKIIKTNPPGNEKLLRRGELAVAGVRYRPRFENGIPAETKNVTLQYVFDNQNLNGVYLEQGENNLFFKDVINQ